MVEGPSPVSYLNDGASRLHALSNGASLARPRAKSNCYQGGVSVAAGLGEKGCLFPVAGCNLVPINSTAFKAGWPQELAEKANNNGQTGRSGEKIQ